MNTTSDEQKTVRLDSYLSYEYNIMGRKDDEPMRGSDRDMWF